MLNQMQVLHIKEERQKEALNFVRIDSGDRLIYISKWIYKQCQKIYTMQAQSKQTKE